MNLGERFPLLIGPEVLKVDDDPCLLAGARLHEPEVAAGPYARRFHCTFSKKPSMHNKRVTELKIVWQRAVFMPRTQRQLVGRVYGTLYNVDPVHRRTSRPRPAALAGLASSCSPAGRAAAAAAALILTWIRRLASSLIM